MDNISVKDQRHSKMRKEMWEVNLSSVGVVCTHRSQAQKLVLFPSLKNKKTNKRPKQQKTLCTHLSS